MASNSISTWSTDEQINYLANLGRHHSSQRGVLPKPIDRAERIRLLEAAFDEAEYRERRADRTIDWLRVKEYLYREVERLEKGGDLFVGDYEQVEKIYLDPWKTEEPLEEAEPLGPR